MRLPLDWKSRPAWRENGYAVLLCLLVIAILIFTAGSTPLWIYQGF